MGQSAIITLYQNSHFFGVALAVGKLFGYWEIQIGFAFWAVGIELKKKTKDNVWFRFYNQKY